MADLMRDWTLCPRCRRKLCGILRASAMRAGLRRAVPRWRCWRAPQGCAGTTRSRPGPCRWRAAGTPIWVWSIQQCLRAILIGRWCCSSSTAPIWRRRTLPPSRHCIARWNSAALRRCRCSARRSSTRRRATRSRHGLLRWHPWRSSTRRRFRRGTRLAKPRSTRRGCRCFKWRWPPPGGRPGRTARADCPQPISPCMLCCPKSTVGCSRASPVSSKRARAIRCSNLPAPRIVPNPNGSRRLQTEWLAGRHWRLRPPANGRWR
ncbi:hypothetical protein D9M73_108710 [compost metagenome]